MEEIRLALIMIDAFARNSDDGFDMVISFQCSCGDVLEVPETFAGRKAYCLRCQKSVDVPIPSRAAQQVSSGTGASSNVPEDTTLSLPMQSDDSPPASPQAPKVTRDVIIPPATKTEPPVLETRNIKAPSGSYDQAPEYELVNEVDGKEHWKVTCFCGKRLLTPTRSENAYGRCPKCGRRIRLPGHDALLKTLDLGVAPIPGGPGGPGGKDNLERKKSAAFTKADLDKALELVLSQDEIVTELALLVPEVPASNDPIMAATTAAMTAADRLRPRHETPRKQASSGGHIAAWPLAGILRRGLAGFIDLTFAITVTALFVVAALQGVIPRSAINFGTILAVFLCTGIFNDGFLHLLLGGSLGKKLVVIVIRNFLGAEMKPARVMLRAVFKWVLMPGWFIAAIDPNERSLHDLLCGTLVLKGRAKKGR